MKLDARLKKLEAVFTTDELIVFIPSVLGENIPEGSIVKRVFSSKTSIDTILTHEEYLAEISKCDNLISIGEA